MNKIVIKIVLRTIIFFLLFLSINSNCLAQYNIICKTFYLNELQTNLDPGCARGAGNIHSYPRAVWSPLKNNINILKKISTDNNNIGLLQYHFFNNKLYIFLLSSNGLIFRDSIQVEDNEILLIQNKLRKALITNTISSKSRGANVLVSGKTNKLDKYIKEMSNLLFPKKLAHKMCNLDYLIIAPEKSISLVPFSLLKPFDNQAYLIDSITYSLAPSLIDFIVLDKIDPINISNKNALIIGNPKYVHNKEYSFPDLPGAEKEAIMVYEKLGSDILLGEKAEITIVKTKMPSANLLYFATHAIANLEGGQKNNFIALTPDSINKLGLLSALEIQKMSLNANLAILSACQTGIGKIKKAGSIGLARAFYLAGVKNTLMTLWSIDDIITRDFMDIFTDYIKNDTTYLYAQILRNTIIDFKKKYPNPKYWAAFTVFGFPIINTIKEQSITYNIENDYKIKTEIIPIEVEINEYGEYKKDSIGDFVFNTIDKNNYNDNEDILLQDGSAFILKFINTGNKGAYFGLIGISSDKSLWYPLSSEFLFLETGQEIINTNIIYTAAKPFGKDLIITLAGPTKEIPIYKKDVITSIHILEKFFTVSSTTTSFITTK